MRSPIGSSAGRVDGSAPSETREFPRDVAIAVAIVCVTLALAVALALAFAAGIADPSGAVVVPVSSGPPTQQSAAASSLSVVAQARGHAVDVYASPTSRSPSAVLESPTGAGDPLTFLVAGVTLNSSWLHVYLPRRPNESQGWVHTDAVTLSQDGYLVDVNLASHKMTVSDDGHVTMSISIGEGRSALPTPTGRFFIVDLLKQPDPSGEYGPYAFGLSAFSDQLQNFGGGPGEIGIHGTDNPSSVGASVSHGCIRVSNATITALAHLLPLGTPVVIHS